MKLLNGFKRLSAFLTRAARVQHIIPRGKVVTAGNIPTTHKLLSSQELQDAWNWLLSCIQVRPENPGMICYFDNKCWNDDPSKPDYKEDYVRTCMMLGRLYLASQFGDHRSLIGMVHGRPATEDILVVTNLDRDSRTVITNEERFRNHLSEHLAFWIRLGVEKKQRGQVYQPETNEFTYSKPHVQPEDKGPDGLYVEIAPFQKVEIQSVKSSINDPQSQISTAQFRTTGKPCPREQPSKPLLDEFWWHMSCDDGLIRLDGLVDQCLNSLQTDTQHMLRLGLIKVGVLNAVIVASSRYSSENLFIGYHYLTPDITRRIATYIGAVDWQRLASGTKNAVIETILKCGVNIE